MEYSGSHRFSISPRDLWSAIERTDRFSEWWGWLEEFHVQGEGLAQGSVLSGVVAPPVPYRMRIRVEILRVEPGAEIRAAVHGDLEGEAWLALHPVPRSDSECILDIGWRVEMMQRPMRLACKFAYPLLRWGHDRVVDMTVASFRRRVEAVSKP
jgi:hypothetical protein